MTMFNGGVAAATQLSQIAAKLSNLRFALEQANDLSLWAAGITNADMATGLGLSSADAQTLKGALADMGSLYSLFATGQAAAGYPQVTGTPFVYASQARLVIGAN
jgi:IS5 family transposase